MDRPCSQMSDDWSSDCIDVHRRNWPQPDGYDPHDREIKVLLFRTGGILPQSLSIRGKYLYVS